MLGGGLEKMVMGCCLNKKRVLLKKLLATLITHPSPFFALFSHLVCPSGPEELSSELVSSGLAGQPCPEAAHRTSAFPHRGLCMGTQILCALLNPPIQEKQE